MNNHTYHEKEINQTKTFLKLLPMLLLNLPVVRLLLLELQQS
jgi:hypothetical protein